MADNGRESDKISAPQRRAIAALLTERNTRDAAKGAKVAERTIYRWLTEPDFIAALRAAEGGVLDAATRRLLGMQAGALDALEGMVTGAEDEAVRLRAALGILAHVLKLRALRDIESRLAALEQELGQNQR